MRAFLLICTGLLLAPLLAEPPAKSDYRFAVGTSAPDIPFELNSNKIYLPVKVDGKGPFWFILDTGAVTTMIDLGRARALGLPVAEGESLSGAGEGRAAGGRTRVRSLGLKGLDYFPGPTAAIGINPVVSPFEGRTIDGLLGSDIFKRFAVVIDYPHRTLSLYEAKSYHYQGSGTVVPLTLRNGHCFAHGSVTIPGGKPLEGEFLIDCGARVALTLNTPFVNDHKLLEATGHPPKATVGGGIGGPVVHYVARLAELRMGNVVVKEPVANLSQDKRSVFAADSFQGLVGAEVLKRYKVVFDYSRSQLILERTADTDRPYDLDLSGLFITASGPDLRTYKVLGVAERSPGAAAGLQAGDAIEALDGHPAAKMSLEELRQAFQQAGTVRKLIVRRGGERHEITLALKRWV